MIIQFLRSAIGALFSVALLAGLALTTHVTFSQNKNKLSLDKVPVKVMDGLKTRFPQAEIHKWSKENEGDIVVYDFEFKQQGVKFEADIKEDGTIHNWEREVGFSSLPDAVKQALNQKYPKSSPREFMEITAVKDGREELEGYEIVLETAQRKVIEVFAPDGRILEESKDGG